MKKVSLTLSKAPENRGIGTFVQSVHVPGRVKNRDTLCLSMTGFLSLTFPDLGTPQGHVSLFESGVLPYYTTQIRVLKSGHTKSVPVSDKIGTPRDSDFCQKNPENPDGVRGNGNRDIGTDRPLYKGVSMSTVRGYRNRGAGLRPPCNPVP